MKSTLSLLLFLCFTLPAFTQDTLTSLRYSRKIDSLINTKHFFEARRLFNENKDFLIEFDRLLVGTSIDNVFNLPHASNEKIEKLLSTYGNSIGDSSLYALLNIAQVNYSRIYEYRKAYDAANEVIDKYSHFMTEEELNDFKNTNIIWQVLADQPQQKITIKKTSVIKMKKDVAGLSNLIVKSGRSKIDFIFDTGANISTVTETTADKFKMKIMDSVIDVTSITGIKIKSKIAVCPVMEIGNIKIQNAVFLVFPDDALAVPQINYQINGIIGFPVIEALKEIQLTQKDEFIVPQKSTEREPHNMALDFLTPVIELNGDSYSFDSGADGTMLYSTYFNRYKDSITAHFKEVDYQFGGAGGNITKKGYFIPFKTEINNQSVTIDSVIVFTEKIKEGGSMYYGNIGQDLIKKFDKMILNFEHMYIGFE